MAAATMAGIDVHRMEQKKFEYFSSINSMARKIMQERKIIEAKHGSSWEKMTPQEQDSAIDHGMMDPHIRARYAMHRVEREEVVCYPKLLLQTGQKIVHFGEEVLDVFLNGCFIVLCGLLDVRRAVLSWSLSDVSHVAGEMSSLPGGCVRNG